MHMRVIMIVKIEKIHINIKEEVINPSGGRLGNDKNRMSGHENSRITKWSVMGIL
jgi:hypothetical protein